MKQSTQKLLWYGGGAGVAAVLAYLLYKANSTSGSGGGGGGGGSSGGSSSGGGNGINNGNGGGHLSVPLVISRANANQQLTAPQNQQILMQISGTPAGHEWSVASSQPGVLNVGPINANATQVLPLRSGSSLSEGDGIADGPGVAVLSFTLQASGPHAQPPPIVDSFTVTVSVT